MLEKKYLGSKLTATLMLVVVIAITAISGKSYLKMRNPGADVDRVVPHAGFEKKRLSDWFEGLAGTPADTDIYVRKGQNRVARYWSLVVPMPTNLPVRSPR